MIYVVGLALLCVAGWWLFGRGKGETAGRSGADASEPSREEANKPSGAAAAVKFDLKDPAIGNPRERMKVMGWNQVYVLRHAAAGLRVFHAEPGESNAEDANGRFFYQARTVNSLKAGFLEASARGGFVITPLGFKALHTVPERGN